MKKPILSAVFISVIFLAAGCGQIQGSSSMQATPIPTVVSESAGIIAEGRIVPDESSSLSFALAGTVGEIYIVEGEQVQRGQELATLEDTEALEARVAQAELARLEAQQALDELHEQAAVQRGLAEQRLADARLEWVEAQEALTDIDTDATREDIDDAWIDVQDAEEEVEDAQEEFEKFEDLDEDNADREAAEEDLEEARDDYDEQLREYHRLKNELDQAHSRMNLAEAQLERADAELEDLQSGPDPDKLASAQARLDQTTAELATADAALSDSILVAPYPGTVAQLEIAEGEQVNPGAMAIVIATLDNLYVETTDLTEMEVVGIKVGDEVVVQPDALPIELQGSVEWIAQTYTERSGDVLYQVRIRLDETDAALRWGMTVECQFSPAQE